MTYLGKLEKREDFRWEIKDQNFNGAFLIDQSKGPILQDHDEGSLYEYYIAPITINKNQYIVTELDVAVLKRKVS